MTLYTSDIKNKKKRTLQTALVYLAASLFCVLFGAVYEIFSHGVYSYFMIYAFLIPLAGGALPWLLMGLSLCKCDRRLPETAIQALYHCGIISLTVGSLMTGVLSIYGTTNRLTSVYWAIGAALIFSAFFLYGIELLLFHRSKRGS